MYCSIQEVGCSSYLCASKQFVFFPPSCGIQDFLFIFSFEYKLSRVFLFVCLIYILLDGLLTSWNCGFMCGFILVIIFGKFLTIISLIFLVLSLSLPPTPFLSISLLFPPLSGAPIILMLDGLILSHSSWIFLFIFICLFLSLLFSLCFSLGIFYWPVFTDSLLSHFQSTDEPLEEFFIPGTVIFISRISIKLSLIVFISLLKLHLFFILSTFSTRYFNISLLVVLKSLLIVLTSASFLSLVWLLCLWLWVICFLLFWCLSYFLLNVRHYM